MAVDITVSCRDINELNPIVKVMLEHGLKKARANGVNPLVVETFRYPERQRWLYCKGRTVAECVAKGIDREFATKWVTYFKEKKIGGPVTWTLDSIHLQRKAVDVIPQRMVNGKMTAIWAHSSKDADSKKLVEAMKTFGFEAGDEWKKNIDTPHYQVKATIGNTVKQSATTKPLTLAIQKALNKTIDKGLVKGIAKLVEDGIWGAKTTAALNAFRKAKKWSGTGYLGATGLDSLFKYLD